MFFGPSFSLFLLVYQYGPRSPPPPRNACFSSFFDNVRNIAVFLPSYGVEERFPFLLFFRHPESIAFGFFFFLLQLESSTSLFLVARPSPFPSSLLVPVLATQLIILLFPLFPCRCGKGSSFFQDAVNARRSPFFFSFLRRMSAPHFSSRGGRDFFWERIVGSRSGIYLFKVLSLFLPFFNSPASQIG